MRLFRALRQPLPPNGDLSVDPLRCSTAGVVACCHRAVDRQHIEYVVTDDR